MVSDDRADRVTTFTPPTTATSPQSPGEAVIGSAHSRSASFDAGGFTLELVATEGTTTLAVLAGQDRDVYTLHSAALEQWGDATARLLGLSGAAGPTGRAEFRAPFLMDAEGRAAIAFESVVTEGGVAHRLLVMGQGGRVAVVATSADMLRELIDAARGAVRFARLDSPASG